MQRQIKFRCWDIYNKEMLDIEYLYWNDCPREFLIRTTMYTDYFTPEEMILMQYTGLHDKNGKEIYEGDIVNDLYSEDELVKPSYYTIGVIKYIEDMSGFFMVSSKNCISSIIDVEVIGNIYENPELLERSNNGD